jgi:linoleate 10R-lipoxygenase
MLTKLLFRHLPNHYPAGSAYAHFPFLVPDYIKKHLGKLPDNPVAKYTWARPPTPTKPVVAKSYDAVSYILSEKETFVSNYPGRVSKLLKGVVIDRQLVSADRRLLDVTADRFSDRSGTSCLLTYRSSVGEALSSR